MKTHKHIKGHHGLTSELRIRLLSVTSYLMFMLAIMGLFSLFFIPSCMQEQSQEVTTISSKEKKHDS